MKKYIFTAILGLFVGIFGIASLGVAATKIPSVRQAIVKLAVAKVDKIIFGGKK